MLEKKKQWFKNHVSIGSTNENNKNSKPCNMMEEKKLFKNQLDIANTLKSFNKKKKKQFKTQHTIVSPNDALNEELKKALRKRKANKNNNDLEKNNLTEEKVEHSDK